MLLGAAAEPQSPLSAGSPSGACTREDALATVACNGMALRKSRRALALAITTPLVSWYRKHVDFGSECVGREIWVLTGYLRVFFDPL